LLGLKAKRRKVQYKEFFSTDDGKEILADLARRHFVHTSTFVPHDTHHSAFNEGRRSVILDIISLVNIPMEELDKLNRKAEDGRDSRTDNDGGWDSEF
jgi:hypothetical protein